MSDLKLKGRMNLGCGALILLFLVSLAGFSALTTVKLLFFGKTTNAVVTSSGCRVEESYADDPEEETSSTTSYYINYEGHAGSQTFRGSASVFERTMRNHPEGSTVTVIYLRGNPAINRYGGRLTILWHLFLEVAAVLFFLLLTLLALRAAFGGLGGGKSSGGSRWKKRR